MAGRLLSGLLAALAFLTLITMPVSLFMAMVVHADTDGIGDGSALDLAIFGFVAAGPLAAFAAAALLTPSKHGASRNER